MNERALELIHGEIDGRNSARDQEELRALLAADPQLNEIRTQLRELTESLDRVPSLEPPDGLRARILEAVRPKDERRGLFDWLTVWPMPTGLRYAGAAAFGAAIATVALQIGGIGQSPSTMDVTGLAGTMARYEKPDSTESLSAINLTLRELSGSIVGHTADGLVVVNMDLDTSEPVEIVAGYEGQSLRFNGYAQLDDAPISVAYGDQRVILSHDGEHHYAVFFRNSDGDASEITFRFLADETLIHEEKLELPPGR